MAQAGMWRGILAGYQDVEAKNLAKEEKEEALRLRREQKEEQTLSRRREIAARLRPQLQESARQVEELRGRATYLLDRGLPQETINAFGEDPEMLNTAYTYAREGAGADASPEALQEIFKVSTLSGASGPRDFMTMLDATSAAYNEGLTGDIDLETFVDPMSVPTPRTSTVEVRMPVEPKEEGLTAMRDRTYKAQTAVFDDTLMTLANKEFQELQRKNDTGSITPEENDRRIVLDRHLTNYSTNLDSRIKLTEQYRDPVVSLMMSSAEKDPDLYAGFLSNPTIFNPASQASVELLQEPQPLTPQGPEGGVFIRTARNPEDGLMYDSYKMPDGTFVLVRR